MKKIIEHIKDDKLTGKKGGFILAIPHKSFVKLVEEHAFKLIILTNGWSGIDLLDNGKVGIINNQTENEFTLHKADTLEEL